MHERGDMARTNKPVNSRQPKPAEEAQRSYEGLAFIMLALAIIVALREWFSLSGLLGDIIHHATAGVAVSYTHLTLPTTPYV